MKNIDPAHLFSYEGATVVVYHANKNQGLSKHSHPYAHATFCCAGSVVVRKEGKELVIDKTTQPLNLVADEWHELEAVEDSTVFINVYASNFK